MTSLFISYSRADSALVQKLVSALRVRSSEFEMEQVFWDHDLPAGEDWWKNILRQIQGCSHFLYLISHSSWNSPFCQAEFDWARKTNRHIVPVKIDPSLRDILFATELHENILQPSSSVTEYADRIIQEVKQKPYKPSVPASITPASQPPRPRYELESAVIVVNKLHKGQTVFDPELIAVINELRTARRNEKYKLDALYLLRSMLTAKKLPMERKVDIEEIPGVRESEPSSIATPPAALTRVSSHGYAESSRRSVKSPKRDLTPTRNLTDMVGESGIINIALAVSPRSAEEFASLSVQIARLLIETDVDLGEFANAFGIEIPYLNPRLIASEIANNVEYIIKILKSNDDRYSNFSVKLYNLCTILIRQMRAGEKQHS